MESLTVVSHFNLIEQNAVGHKNSFIIIINKILKTLTKRHGRKYKINKHFYLSNTYFPLYLSLSLCICPSSIHIRGERTLLCTAQHKIIKNENKMINFSSRIELQAQVISLMVKKIE
jgi:hypothetical protein